MPVEDQVPGRTALILNSRTSLQVCVVDSLKIRYPIWRHQSPDIEPQIS